MQDEIWDQFVSGGRIFAMTRGRTGPESRMCCEWVDGAWKDWTDNLVHPSCQPDEVERFALLASLPEKPARRHLKTLGLAA